MSPLALGVDVAARRGCDVVALGDDLVALPVARVHTAEDLRAVLADLDPDVVGIDSPPRWAIQGPRACERALTRRGISVFTTPDEATGVGHPFYAWMQTGFAMFEAARGYPTLETYPHAAAIALRRARPEGSLMKRPAQKRQWRRDALAGAGIDPAALRTIDQIDAALCAATGRWYLEGRTEDLGDPAEGVLTVPLGLDAIRPRDTP